MPTFETPIRRPPGPDNIATLGVEPETLATLTYRQREYGDIVGMDWPGFRPARTEGGDPGPELAIALRSNRDIFLRPWVR